MPAPNGTCLSRFKRAYVDKVNTANGGTIVAYGSPQTAADIMGPTGAGVAAWFLDEASANHGVTVVKGFPMWVDETVSPILRIQAIGLNTDETQETVDTRAEGVLGIAIAVLAADPSVGLTDDTIQEFDAIPGSWAYAGGVTGQNERAASYELTINVEARLKLTLP